MSKAQLSRLIDLPDEALQQVLDYAASLSKAEAADHFTNLLGDGPAVVEFVAAFNGRRHDPKGATASEAAAAAPEAPAASAAGPAAAAPSRQARPKKAKRLPLHTPPPRQVTGLAPPLGTVYHKKNAEEDYIIGRSGTTTPLPSAGSGSASPLRAATPVSASSTAPPPTQQQPQKQPQKQQQQQQQQPKPRPAGGSLIQDALAPKPKNKAAPAAKISITGGTAMHGASTVLADFDAAIRSLEATTNPTLHKESDEAARRCNCVATRHPLQTAAPNCLQCGKVVCVKEGLGPCTFCGAALLSPAEVQAMIKELKVERGREKMAADREAHRRVDTAGGGKNKMGARMIAGTTKWGGDDDGFVSLAEAAEAAKKAVPGKAATAAAAAAAAGPADAASAEAKARAHRDKLLAFQAQNAQRTTVRDEASDFDVSAAMAPGGSTGGSLWATPEERARELRRQQKVLRELEWHARPAYEKRQQVLSIDTTGRKVVLRKTVAAVERPPSPQTSDSEAEDGRDGGGGGGGGSSAPAAGSSGGAFSRNPLLGRLIRPVYEAPSAGGGGDNGTLPAGRHDEAAVRGWRRVQDNLDDNETVILDGGLLGPAAPTTTRTDEPACA